MDLKNIIKKLDLRFNTIKSRISVILGVITVIFFAVIVVFCYTYFTESEKYIIDNYDYSIKTISQKLNKNIITVEHNARDIAVAGRTYYEHKVSNDLMNQYLENNLKHYKDPVSVGIWYLPYKYNKNKKLFSLNADRDENGNIYFNPAYKTEQYNYPERKWYNNIVSQVSPAQDIVWTLAHGTPKMRKDYPLLITAGSGIYDKGQLVGISTVDWSYDACINIMSQIKPTHGSFTLFADPKQNFVFFSTDPNMFGKDVVGYALDEIPWYSNKLKNRVAFKYNKITYIPFIEILDNGMMLIVNVPKNEMLGMMYNKVFFLLLIMGLLSSSLITLLYASLNRNVINPINKLITIANKIAKGEKNAEIKIESPKEFALLASTYDKMTNSIKQITKEQTKMHYELSVANSIQISSLPNIFPPFPEHKEFSIFASMQPAKEVGGDFYDFYFKDSENLMFLVADVSGKGVPAALFMMTVKTLINNLSQTISSPKELIETVNKKLCANNKEGFFVTLFACIVNIYTGKMTCINCGHNPPLLKRNNGKYEYMNIEPNMVLGIFDKFEYQIYETDMHLGDSIFLYTDGITEAMNPLGQVYNERRLEECLNNNLEEAPIETVITKVKEDVREYIQGQAQSDDATMLIFRYNKTLRNFKSHAEKENYNEFKNWIHSASSEWHLNDDLSNKIDMCGEEIFANICFYAYPDTVGDITVSLEKNDKELIMTFEDKGLFYNPLEKPDPDFNIPPKERQLGGLGIYMVKQMAKEMEYKRERDKNILKLRFDI